MAEGKFQEMPYLVDFILNATTSTKRLLTQLDAHAF